MRRYSFRRFRYAKQQSRVALGNWVVAGNGTRTHNLQVMNLINHQLFYPAIYVATETDLYPISVATTLFYRLGVKVSNLRRLYLRHFLRGNVQ